MKLSDARLLSVEDRVLARYAGKTGEGWIVFIDHNPGTPVFTTYWIAVLGERYTWAVFPRQIVRKAPT